MRLVILFVLTAFMVQAEAREVKVTSFQFVDRDARTAEICGELIGEKTALDIVDMTVDPNTKIAGDYSVLISNKGNFCVIVYSVYGRVEYLLRGTTAQKSVALAAGQK